MKYKPLHIAGFAIGCGAAGFIMGRHFNAKMGSAASSELHNAIHPVGSIPRSEDFASKTTRQVQSIVEEWQVLQHRPLTPESEDNMRALLQSLGASDPETALNLAQNAPTPRQREIFRNAALQGWATCDAQAAVTWTLKNVRFEERRTAVEALASGAASKPEAAIRAFRYLITSDPLLASDHGNALVTAFARAGIYETASQFASTGPAEFRVAWFCTLYNHWGTYQPVAALLSLERISDPAAAQEARASCYAGWGSSDPAGLVNYAQALPPGDARIQALNEGLAQWVHRDPAAASIWMDKFDPSPELDAGAAAVAVESSLITKKPDVAVSWAESITNPELRASTLLDLIRLWAEHDSAAARRYAASSRAIAPETRELALAICQSPP